MAGGHRRCLGGTDILAVDGNLPAADRDGIARQTADDLEEELTLQPRIALLCLAGKRENDEVAAL